MSACDIIRATLLCIFVLIVSANVFKIRSENGPATEQPFLIHKPGEISSANGSSTSHVKISFKRKISPPGVIVEAACGIGNQLFLYAAAYAVAQEMKWPLYVYSNEGINKIRRFAPGGREFAMDKFSIPELNMCSEKYKSTSHAMPEEDVLYRKFVNLTSHQFLRVKAYCQSPEYWIQNYGEEIQRILQPIDDVVSSMSENVTSVLNDIKNTESVAVHVRRGDFVTLYQFFLPFSYQRKAIWRMVKILNKKNRPTPVFFVFSDDIEFVKRNLKDLEVQLKIVYVTDMKTTSIQDFYLMTKCKHIILGTSTFSWWAAFLNLNENKTVIASAYNPEFYKPFEDNEPVYKFKRELHGTIFYPLSWTVIDPFSGGF